MKCNRFRYSSMLALIVMVLHLACSRLSAQTCDTTDWVLVLIGPWEYISPSGGSLLPAGAAYLLGRGDTAAQVAAILRLETRYMRGQVQRPRDLQRLYRVRVLPWWEAFRPARKIVIDPFPTLPNHPIRTYNLRVKVHPPGRPPVWRSIDFYLERVPIAALTPPLD